MNRRKALQLFGTCGALASTPAALRPQTARSGLPPVKITDVKTILPQVSSDYLVVVKVMTSEPGLYGIGCATHGERPLAVAPTVNEYLKPFLIGKDPEQIEDIWQSAYGSSYFRGGVTPDNALSGVDSALWGLCCT